jgi:hypothetical protein
VRRLDLPLLALCAIVPPLLQAAEPKRQTVVDYFLLLPWKDYFEDKPENLLRFLRQPKCGMVDEVNGYLSCIGDGAQPGFQVALFRYRDGRPLLAVSMGELEGPDSKFLELFEQGKDGTMKKAARAIFPVGDGKGRQFVLPRHGRTVLVRDEKSGVVRQKFTWDGERFHEEK